MQPVSTRSVSPGASVRSISVPAGVDEGEAVAGEPLHDEAFAAEQADPEPLLERDADAHALGGAKEGVLLRDEFAAELAQVDRDDLAGVGRPEGDLPFPPRPGSGTRS